LTTQIPQPVRRVVDNGYPSPHLDNVFFFDLIPGTLGAPTSGKNPGLRLLSLFPLWSLSSPPPLCLQGRFLSKFSIFLGSSSLLWSSSGQVQQIPFRLSTSVFEEPPVHPIPRSSFLNHFKCVPIELSFLGLFPPFDGNPETFLVPLVFCLFYCACVQCPFGYGLERNSQSNTNPKVIVPVPLGFVHWPFFVRFFFLPPSFTTQP